jgi:AraC-like DNA-binding protein
MISIGSPCNDPLMVKHSSFEAGAAVQLAVPKSGQIYFYQKTENLEHENYMIPCMEKSLLIEGIRHGDIETSLTALDSIIGYIERSGYSFFLVRLLCSELLNTLINLAKENNIQLDQNELKDIVIFNEISDFQYSAIKITKSLCRKIHAQLDLSRTLQKQDVLSFIAENFTREDFSLDLIADSLNLTKSKISAILKEDVGCGFPQYISILRMNEIKRQLVESTNPIQDIIRSVGYLDVPNFIRKFKMVEGVTPGQFRTLYGKK